ncbi:alpha/beta fold hydrolase [Nocardioides limicola]|uniref:alpha/beta fold hydrolase n=1 Tax=Nocardioides limicola TaxID=2803368 RepID=UPI00193AFF19|nr:alpha/beta hydrolase [Nocardioides sp. DJM-14]
MMIQLPSGTVAYDDSGDGDPVLLVHATLHDRSDYDEVARELARSHRVLALDWPGHGESPRAPKPESAALFGQILTEFVDALQLVNLVIVGNSVGGFAACQVALDRPTSVAGLVLVQGSGFAPRTRAIRAFCRLQGSRWAVRAFLRVQVPRYMRARTPRDREIVRRVVARSRTAEGSRVAASLWRSFNDPRHDLRQRGRDIEAPTLVTWGSLDKNLNIAWGRAIERTIPDTRFVDMATGHLPFSSDPRGWCDLVAPFIAHVQSAPSSERDIEYGNQPMVPGSP